MKIEIGEGVIFADGLPKTSSDAVNKILKLTGNVEVDLEIAKTIALLDIASSLKAIGIAIGVPHD